MDTLYIDCRMGVSGTKLLGAFVDILDKPEQFIRRFNELGFRGMSIDRQAEAENGITGSRAFFKRENDNPDYNEYGSEVVKSRRGEHYGGQRSRTLSEIEAIIDELPLSGKIRKRAMSIYENIAAAQAKVKQKNMDEVHLRRTGTRDVIASVVGVCMIVDELDYDKIVVSTVATGKGYAATSRGLLPIPIPVLQILLGDMPYISGSEEGEICTLEGAALLQNIADEFAEMPEMTILRSGAGFGGASYKSGINCVRIYEGTPVVTAANAAFTELKAVLYNDSANALSLTAERIESLGVKEAYTYPITSLHGERGYVLKCLCANEIADSVAGEILKNTSATEVQRVTIASYEPQKSISIMKTSIGEVSVLKTTGFGINDKKPVADDVLKIAKENNMSYSEAYDIIIKEI